MTTTNQILDQCLRQGLCPLNRHQFDETFGGRDLTIQLRAALDFAQAHDLAFARSFGDQQFAFSRLAKVSGVARTQERPQRDNRHHHHGRRPQANPKPLVSSNRPYGRSF